MLSTVIQQKHITHWSIPKLLHTHPKGKGSSLYRIIEQTLESKSYTYVCVSTAERIPGPRFKLGSLLTSYLSYSLGGALDSRLLFDGKRKKGMSEMHSMTK